MGWDTPHQAEGMDDDLYGTVRAQGDGEATIGIEEGVWIVELLLLSCEIGTNVGRNRVDVDSRAIEASLLNDVDFGVDLYVVRSVNPCQIIGDAVDKVAQVD